MPIPMLLNAVETDNTFLGAVAENYVAQALRANGIDLRYWKTVQPTSIPSVSWGKSPP